MIKKSNGILHMCNLMGEKKKTTPVLPRLQKLQQNSNTKIYQTTSVSFTGK